MAGEPAGRRPDIFKLIRTRVGGVLSALRAFVGVLTRKSSGPERASRPEAEPVQPASPALVQREEEGELPAFYGQAKVTLNVVNPYLLFAYWDIDTTRLPAGTRSAILRFEDTAEGSRPFDVDLDLRARSWYVHLWTPAKSYQARLGVKVADGSFVSLARSNSVQTPRAWPMADTGVPAPPAQTFTTAPATERPKEPEAIARVEAPPRKEEIPVARSKPRPAAAVILPPTSGKPVDAAPTLHKPVDAAAALQRKLSELARLRPPVPRAASAAVAAQYQEFLRRGRTQPDVPATEAPGLWRPSSPAFPQRPTRPDLTAVAEHQFSPGFSSAVWAALTRERRSP